MKEIRYLFVVFIGTMRPLEGHKVSYFPSNRNNHFTISNGKDRREMIHRYFLKQRSPRPRETRYQTQHQTYDWVTSSPSALQLVLSQDTWSFCSCSNSPAHLGAEFGNVPILCCKGASTYKHVHKQGDCPAADPSSWSGNSLDSAA